LSDEELERLVDLAAAYQRLETLVETQLKEGNESDLVERVAVCMLLADQIRGGLRDYLVVNIGDRQVRDTLSRIRDEKTFVDRLLAEQQPALMRLMEERGFLVESQFDPAEYDKAQDELVSEVWPPNFVERKKKAGALVLGQSTPSTVQRIFSEIKACYVYRQPVACVALCRTLLEVVLRDILERRGILRIVGRDEFQDWGLSKLLREAKQRLGRDDARGAMLDAAEKIIETSSVYIHGKDKSGAGMSEEHCLRWLRTTLAVVEYLYKI
jgi:hypothetical protein